MLKSLILLLVMVGTGRAQTDKLRAEIRALYTPVDLKNDTDLARAARYFAVVKNKPNLPDYVEALRAELEDSRDRARMLPHGTATLLFLSDAPENLAFAVRMLARMDFREVRVFDYYTILTRLVRKNVDVSLAVFRLLAIPDVRLDFSFSPSLNGFSYDQADLVAGLLVPTSEAFWADQAIERLATESDPVAQATLLRLVWYAQSDFGDAELARFANDSQKPVSSRELARELLDRVPNLSVKDRQEVLSSTEDELRSGRQRRTAGIFVKRRRPHY